MQPVAASRRRRDGGGAAWRRRSRTAARRLPPWPLPWRPPPRLRQRLRVCADAPIRLRLSGRPRRGGGVETGAFGLRVGRAWRAGWSKRRGGLRLPEIPGAPRGVRSHRAGPAGADRGGLPVAGSGAREKKGRSSKETKTVERYGFGGVSHRRTTAGWRNACAPGSVMGVHKAAHTGMKPPKSSHQPPARSEIRVSTGPFMLRINNRSCGKESKLQQGCTELSPCP